MATKRSTFQKRQRETDLKDKARAKEARRAAKRDRGDAPDDETAQAEERAREAEIAAAIATAQAASNMIAHDARRAASALPTLSDSDSQPSNPAAPADAPVVERKPKT